MGFGSLGKCVEVWASAASPRMSRGPHTTRSFISAYTNDEGKKTCGPYCNILCVVHIFGKRLSFTTLFFPYCCSTFLSEVAMLAWCLAYGCGFLLWFSMSLWCRHTGKALA